MYVSKVSKKKKKERKVSVRSGMEIQVQGEKGMIKRSDIKECLSLYCSNG